MFSSRVNFNIRKARAAYAKGRTKEGQCMNALLRAGPLQHGASSLFDVNEVGSRPTESFGHVHFLGFSGRDYELAGRRCSCDVRVVVNTLPKERAKCLGPLVAEVLVLEPVPSPPVIVASQRSAPDLHHAGVAAACVWRDSFSGFQFWVQDLKPGRQLIDQ